MRSKLLLTIITYLSTISFGLFAQELVHQFKFNGTLNDSLPSGISLVSSGCRSQQFGPDGWTWRGDTIRGGGLILRTNKLTNPQAYSIGFQIKFTETSPSYKKIISFKDSLLDSGLYFYNNTMVLYPYSKDTIKYNSNTFYNFLLTRDESDTIKVYLMENNSKRLVYKVLDVSDNTVPLKTDDYYTFEFFRDDKSTKTEFSNGGTVQNIQLWNSSNKVIGLSKHDISESATSCFVQDGTLTISGPIYHKRILIYSLQGSIIEDLIAKDNTTNILLPHNGIYLVQVDGHLFRLFY